MAAQIRSLTFRAKQGQEGQSGHDRHEKMQGHAGALEGKTHGAEHADDTEDRCGKTNEPVSWSMNQDIEIIGGN